MDTSRSCWLGGVSGGSVRNFGKKAAQNSGKEPERAQAVQGEEDQGRRCDVELRREGGTRDLPARGTSASDGPRSDGCFGPVKPSAAFVGRGYFRPALDGVERKDGEQRRGDFSRGDHVLWV